MERHGIARMRLVQTQRVVVCAPFFFFLFFFIFFLFSFFFSFFLLLLFLPPSFPPSFLSLSQTRSTDLPVVLWWCSLRFFAASQKTPRFAFWPLPPLTSPIPLPTASPRFRLPFSFRPVSPLDFSASLPLSLPLLNNCPPRGKTRRGGPGAILHHRRDRKMHLDEDVSPLPRRKRWIALCGTLSHFVSDQYWGVTIRRSFTFDNLIIQLYIAYIARL